MQLNLVNSYKKKFGGKIFAIFTFLVVALTISFGVLFYRHESKEVTDRLVENNLLLASVLAYNSRLGVFSESAEQLRIPMEAIFQQDETVAVSIYNLEGQWLAGRERPEKEGRKTVADAGNRTRGIEIGMFTKLQNSSTPFFLDNPERMEFWSPVSARAGYTAAESLFLGGQLLPGSERHIGFVRIVISKAELWKKLHSLMWESILIGIFFLAVGSVFIYWMAQRLTNPLGKLIGGVQALERGNFGEEVLVETEDEIGRLALAFNQMSATLLQRETEKKQIEERLRHSQRMEAIGTLAGGIAHDFNNILGVIVGNTEMAMTTSPEMETQRYLREIFKAGIRARNLVRQILSFSRQGKQERHPSPIGPVIEEALAMMRASLPATIEIRADIKPDLAPVLTDLTQIHQVVMNLCTNAGHAMQESGGVLAVKLQEVDIGAGDPTVLAGDLPPGRYQILTVSDTGQGMEAAVRERIFDPFFTTKEPGKGTGMGLSVVHGIVKSHGGKITCVSEPGRGATFEVFFPTTEDKVVELPEQIDSLPRGREGILFVDDEAVLADVGRQLLQGLGYDVVAEKGSSEALETFRGQPGRFDLLITDHNMPNMTGLELVKNIRLIRPDLPVILCTGYSEGLSEEKLRGFGIGGVLMKPIIRKNLARAVRQVLEESKGVMV